MMPGFRCLRYVKGDQVRAEGKSLRSVPLALGGNPIGTLDGLLIDLPARCVRYLVVEASDTGDKYLFPLDATALDHGGRCLARVSCEEPLGPEPFDPSAVEPYDDDALMSLLFGESAA